MKKKFNSNDGMTKTKNSFFSYPLSIQHQARNISSIPTVVAEIDVIVDHRDILSQPFAHQTDLYGASEINTSKPLTAVCGFEAFVPAKYPTNIFDAFAPLIASNRNATCKANTFILKNIKL
jgi:hypothetical protein